MAGLLRVPFGLRGETLYEPHAVGNGKSCGCVCPACKRPLIARQNHSTPHFAHAPGDDCVKALETAVHLAAKQLIADQRRLRLPAVTFTNIWGSNVPSRRLAEERIVNVDFVSVEPWLDGIRPDLVVQIGADRYLVEIAVTHFVDETKRAKILERKIPAIEIDASNLKQHFTFIGLEELLFRSSYQAGWIFNPEVALLSQEARMAREAEDAEGRKANERETERFRKYREMPAAEKLQLNLDRIGISMAGLKQLTVRVPWEGAFGTPRAIWQTSILAYIKKEFDDDPIGVPNLCKFDPDDCLSWLLRVTATNAGDKETPRVAFWKYLHHLIYLGILNKYGSGDYAIAKHPKDWVSAHG